MNSSEPIFVDANVLVYFLDETAEQHESTVAILQQLVDAQTDLYTSHHVLEEVLFIVSRLSPNKATVSMAIRQIAQIPNLGLVEPSVDFAFAERYAKLFRRAKVGINDTLLLQLMLDAGITRLFSYDEKFLKQAGLFKIHGL